MLSKLAVRRLTKLADYMDALPRSAAKHFDMIDYYRGFTSDAAPKASDLNKCGTSACAAGWAATMPYFKRLGLRVDLQAMSINESEIFDINTHDWFELFNSDVPVNTPKQWAAHCRRYIKANS